MRARVTTFEGEERGPEYEQQIERIRSAAAIGGLEGGRPSSVTRNGVPPVRLPVVDRKEER